MVLEKMQLLTCLKNSINYIYEYRLKLKMKFWKRFCVDLLLFWFRWEVVGNEDGIQYGPFPVPKHGLPVKITPRTKIFTWTSKLRLINSQHVKKVGPNQFVPSQKKIMNIYFLFIFHFVVEIYIKILTSIYP